MDITSTQNQTYKLIKALKTKKARNKYGKYTVEGIKSVFDAVRAGADIDFIAVSDKFKDAPLGYTVHRISDDIFAKLCDTDTPQGIMAVINISQKADSEFDKQLYLYCDRVTDPGNMGTIIRICDAVDCGLILSKGCTDIYSPKTVRASMGSFFHVKLKEDADITVIEELKSKGFSIYAGALSDTCVDFSDADYNGKTVIVVGNEANGVCEEILNIADKCVKIPIWGRAESLNVSVAAALLLYKAKQEQGF